MWPLILTTEEISEIEDKGLALSTGNQGISFLTHLAVLSLSLSAAVAAVPEWLHPAHRVFIWQPYPSSFLRIKQTQITIMFN